MWKKVRFIADMHFYHENIIRHCNRPFANAAEMNAVLINNWNAVVDKDCKTFIIGDVGIFPTRAEFLNTIAKLNNIENATLVVGNHDHLKPYWFDYVTTVIPHRKEIRIRFGQEYKEYKDVIMDHYPLYSWNKKAHCSWHLFGHIHTNTIPTEQFLTKCVSVEKINYTPISFDAVAEELFVKEDSFRKLGKANEDGDNYENDL